MTEPESREDVHMANLRLGVDIGGTFTDHVLYDQESGRVHTLKTPSTPEDLSLCVLEGIRRFDAGRDGGSVGGGSVGGGVNSFFESLLVLEY